MPGKKENEEMPWTKRRYGHGERLGNYAKRKKSIAAETSQERRNRRKKMQERNIECNIKKKEKSAPKKISSWKLLREG